MSVIERYKMLSNLLSLEETRSTLASTEPLEEVSLALGRARFFLNPAWNTSAKALPGNSVVNASIVTEGREIPLTKNAVLQAAGRCGLTGSYVLKTPYRLIEEHLNYWYSEGLKDGTDFKLLMCDGAGAAVTRATVRPFSNVRILDEVVKRLQESVPGLSTADILVDRKMVHSLDSTRVRLVLPTQTFKVDRTGVNEDIWSVGLSIYNSLIGKGQTSIEGYLFRWTCSNGAIDSHSAGNKWSRRTEGQIAENVYEWARYAVDDVLGGLEDAFKNVQKLVDTPLGSSASEVIRDLFNEYKLRGRDREKALANLTESGDLSMYSLMNSVTAVASLEDRDADEQDALMRAGGSLPHSVSERCGTCHRVKAI